MTRFEIRRAPVLPRERTSQSTGFKLAWVYADTPEGALEAYMRGEGHGTKKPGHKTGFRSFERRGRVRKLGRPNAAALPVRWHNRQRDEPVKTELWAWPEPIDKGTHRPRYSKRLPFNVGVTATRVGLTEAQKAAVAGLLADLRQGEQNPRLLYGMCRGGDDDMAQAARDIGYLLIGYPGRGPQENRGLVQPDSQKPERPYIERNQDIVNDCHVLIAGPSGTRELQRSGTWSTVRRARKAARSHYIVWPDGRVEFVPTPDPLAEE